MSIIVVNITSAVSAVPTSKVPNSLKVIGTTLYVKKSYAAKPTRIQLQQVVSIIKKRLDYMGVKKRTFNIDENSGEIEIKLYTTNLTYINKPVTLISEIIKPSIITFQDVYKEN
jgi:hypothetical protein